MQFRLNRLFSVFEKSFVIIFLIWLIVSSTIAFGSWDQYAAALTVTLLLIFAQIFRSSKYIYVSQKEIKYTRREIIDREQFFTRRSKNTTKVHYFVSDIKEFEVKQNGFERLFNVARITFRGTTEYDTKERYMHRIEPREIHTVRGVVLSEEFLDHIDGVDAEWSKKIGELRRNKYRKRK